jgi:hypothetical protein
MLESNLSRKPGLATWPAAEVACAVSPGTVVALETPSVAVLSERETVPPMPMPPVLVMSAGTSVAAAESPVTMKRSSPGS